MIPAKKVTSETVIKSFVKDKIIKSSNRLLTCELCDFDKLTHSRAFKALIKEASGKCAFRTCCENCIRISQANSMVIFVDTLEAFLKRKKSGWIDQMFSEYLEGEK